MDLSRIFEGMVGSSASLSVCLLVRLRGDYFHLLDKTKSNQVFGTKVHDIILDLSARLTCCKGCLFQNDGIIHRQV